MGGPSKGPNRHRWEKTPHPTSSLGHPLPRGEGKLFSARKRAQNNLHPLPRGEGGPRRALSPAGAGRVRGLFPSSSPIENIDSRICQTSAASPAEPGGSPNGLEWKTAFVNSMEEET